jgi:uncharacterized membrane protein
MDNQPVIFNYPDQKQTLPNSTAVLVLGIISIVGSFCYGFIGFICGIVALALSPRAFKLYQMNPGAYTSSSYNNLVAGRVCAIIGVVIASIVVVAVLFLVGAIFSISSLQHHW